MKASLFALALFLAMPTGAAAQCNCGDQSDWKKSFASGDNGIQATEVRQFVIWDGKIMAATGGWMDQTAPKGNASIIRLDGPDGPWQIETTLNSNPGTTTGGLAALHFTQSKNQNVDAWALVAATWSGANAYTRNEADKKWYKHSFGEGQIRSFGVHKDTIAGETFAFAGGKPGIYKGQLSDNYRAAGASPIEWMGLEFDVPNNLPLCSGGGRVTGFAEAQGKFFAAACWNVYVRHDGPIGKCSGPAQVEEGGKCNPRWTLFWTDPLAGQGESGLRGITQVKHGGQEVLLIGSEVANAHVTRLDPASAQSVVEFNVDQFLDSLWNVNSGYKIIPYNSPMPLWYGPDGIGRRVLGFESWLPGAPKPDLVRKLVNIDDGSPQQMLGEGMLFLREEAGRYTLQHIPASASPQPMTAVRDCIASPFPAECNAQKQDCILYCGGFDSNKSTTQTPCTVAPCTFPPLTPVPTHATGWIAKGRIHVEPAAASIDPNEGKVPHIGAGDEPAQ
jgi:hypothetical protein